MANLCRLVALLAVVQGGFCQFNCPSGWNDKAGTPKCAGAMSATCSTMTCCDKVKTCSEFSAAWATAQLLGQGCATDTKFFDLKKASVEVASPAGDAQVKAACCTPFADAKCSDWAITLGTCPSGKKFVGTNNAPANSGNGKQLTTTKYRELCCVDAPGTCATYAVQWAAAQLLGLGCAPDTKFFDFKKASVEVADPKGDAQIKSACCTPFADAKCSDWAITLGTCPGGKKFVGTNNAAADSGNGKKLTTTKYHELCCVETPKTCGTFAVQWAAAQLLGQGCATDTKFFDLKKTSVSVASPAGDAQVKAACCTQFADAKCSDWNTMSCSSGTFLMATNDAPANSGNGKALTNAKFQELCCGSPMKCEDWAEEASSSVPQATASVVVCLSVIVAMVV